MQGVAAFLVMVLITGGCEAIRGPQRTGEIELSSQRFMSETYYLYGYSYEKADYFRFPFQGEPEPDIINEAFRALIGGSVVLLPGFNTPAQENGFALLGTFGTLEEAREFYKGYSKVEDGLQFEIVSDTVELYQVWLQHTVLGNYAKLLVRNIQNFEDESGAAYNLVNMDYTYQPDGSTSFSE